MADSQSAHGLKRIDLSSGPAEYRLQGNPLGPPLLLLHCAGGNGEIFYMLRPELEKHFLVLSADLYGHGPLGAEFQSSMGGEAFTRRAVAAQLELVDALRASGELPGQPMLVLGVSLGGQVGLRLALGRPAGFSRLVIADTWADTILLRPGARFESYHREWARQNPGKVNDWIGAWLRTRPDVLAKMLAMYEGKSQESAAFRAITQPVLLLCGAEDEVTPPAEMEKLAALIPAARLQILPGLKHLPMVENPEAFLAQALPFLLGKC